MVEAVDAPQTLFRAPLTPGVGVQGQNHFKNLSAIKIYTYAKFHPDWSDGLWGPGPSRSGLWAQKYDLLPLKQTFPTTFVL